ncbi:diguanylate cyclase [Myxococcus sp. MISCRS1]|uniref:GGDEF domain-containing response regulator n=1 Tax=unclassified Myxococcus TaxID=2648731 RepID=UPI001CBD7AD4|nr:MULTISPECIES: diguanylate cyclase [unclassified Myxococcus]MCY1001943.1 diguanylate cyclase [Myxococcus sp. MISCRS1]BDT36490.1 diguanylate cyclase [Myxococcus sp. MH1]
MTSRPHTLLVVDEAESTLARLARALGPEDYCLRLISPGPEVGRLAREVDLVVWVGGRQVTGDWLDKLLGQEGPPGPPVMVLTPREPRESWLEALTRGAEVMFDPWDVEELRARVARCLTVHARFSQLSNQVGELQRLSSTDGLTGVHNHRHFQERLREEFRRAQRYDDPLSLILMDLDHFKQVNDRHGHTTGDGVLREVAAALQQSVRETDLVARYGGEEFAVLLPRTHLTGALTVAERVRKDLATLQVGPQGSLRVTASLGLSSFPHRTVLSPEQLLLTADEALYRAKAEGRDRVCLHSQMPLLPPNPSQGE